MAESIGQSGAFKDLISILRDHDIQEIYSIDQIEEFLRSYEVQKTEIVLSVEKEVDKKIKGLESDIKNHKLILDDDIRIRRDKFIHKLNTLILNRNRLQKLKSKTFLAKIIRHVRIVLLGIRIYRLRKRSINKVHRATKHLNRKLFNFETEYYDFKTNRNEIIESLISIKSQKLEHIKQTLDVFSHQISGAIGEQKVINELEKLPADYTIINDFTLHFDPPIFIKKTQERIHSVQIDHLVLSRAGIFLIETKNWSNNSIESLDLRSPVEQIVRNGRALFIKVQNSIKEKSIEIDAHHWGNKQIPIRNLIVMINNKPNGEFEFVRVKLLRELNGYIKYFKDALSNRDYESVRNYFIELSN